MIELESSGVFLRRKQACAGECPSSGDSPTAAWAGEARSTGSEQGLGLERELGPARQGRTHRHGSLEPISISAQDGEATLLSSSPKAEGLYFPAPTENPKLPGALAVSHSHDSLTYRYQKECEEGWARPK